MLKFHRFRHRLLIVEKSGVQNRKNTNVTFVGKLKSEKRNLWNIWRTFMTVLYLKMASLKIFVKNRCWMTWIAPMREPRLRKLWLTVRPVRVNLLKRISKNTFEYIRKISEYLNAKNVKQRALKISRTIKV